MTRIKICGLKTLSDARFAAQAGADYLGFNFYPPSPRFLQTGECAEITAALKNEFPELKLVGVFVNAALDEIQPILRLCALDLAQLHGDEGPEFRTLLGDRAFKAFRGVPQDPASFARDEAPAFLVDASVKDAYGGTGETADWSATAALAKRYPLFLAGGLTPGNVADAVRQVRPWGVDTASGVESSPGCKDEAKVSSFIEAVRQVEPE